MIRPLLVLASLAACAPTRTDSPRGVVLVIGDGMGAAHVTLAGLLRGEQFRIGRMPHVGLVTTRSADSLVTDSAAAATAYSTGVQTANGMVGLGPDGVARQTVVELAESRGLATGLVTTAGFADATPAAFAAHHRDRKDARALAEEIVRSGVDVLVSSGLERFGVDLPALEELARAGGYQSVQGAATLHAATNDRVLAALGSGEHDGDSPDARLPALATWALERVTRDPDGFFLLLEHEGIDTASHHGATAQLEASLRSLDETVEVVLEFAERHGDILVVVVGDHETGGLQLQGALERPQVVWTTDGHTGESVPLFASGPGAARFAGSLDGAGVGRALRAAVAAIEPR